MFFAKTLPNSTPIWSNELMFQITPCVKILCSYKAIKRAERFRVEQAVQKAVGRAVAAKCLGGCQQVEAINASASVPSTSARASSKVRPFISASVWAKKFDSKISWCSPTGLCVCAAAKKSQGIILVPW